jgi:hypothetical protein
MVYTNIFDAKPVVNNAFKNPHLRIRRVLRFFHVDKVYIDIKEDESNCEEIWLPRIPFVYLQGK